MSDEVLTTKDVARILRLAEKTNYSMAKRGELVAFMVCGQWHIRRLDFDAWMEENSKKTHGGEDGGER